MSSKFLDKNENGQVLNNHLCMGYIGLDSYIVQEMKKYNDFVA